MKFRKRGSRSEVDIEYEDFKTRIAAGEIDPLDEVLDSYFTDNEWRTVNNLRIFHKLAPGEHEQGDVLTKDIARREAEAEAQRRVGEISAAGYRLLHELDEELTTLTRQRMSDQAAESPAIHGISALTAMPSFGVRTIFHFVYREDRVDIHMTNCPRDPMSLEVRADDTLETMRERVRYDPEAIQPRIGRLDYGQLPPAIASWDELRIMAMRAAREPEDLEPTVLDGVMYTHELLTGDENLAYPRKMIHTFG